MHSTSGCGHNTRYCLCGHLYFFSYFLKVHSPSVFHTSLSLLSFSPRCCFHQAQDHPHVPMYIELSKLHPPDLLRPLAQPLHLPNPQQATLRALCRLSPPTDTQPEVPVIANSLSSSLPTSSSPHVLSSLSSGKLVELSPKDNAAAAHYSFSSSSSSSSPPPPPMFASALSPASFTTSGLPPNTLPFVEARALVRSEKLLRAHWPQWRDSPTKRPSNVPAQPEEVRMKLDPKRSLTSVKIW